MSIMFISLRDLDDGRKGYKYKIDEIRLKKKKTDFKTKTVLLILYQKHHREPRLYYIYKNAHIYRHSLQVLWSGSRPQQ